MLGEDVGPPPPALLGEPRGECTSPKLPPRAPGPHPPAHCRDRIVPGGWFQGIRVPNPTHPLPMAPAWGRWGQGAGGTDLPEGSLAVAAHPPELLELLVPAAGSRPSPRDAGARDTVATGSESEGLTAGFVRNTHRAPRGLCFRRPVSRETKAPVFFREHKTGFFLSSSSPHPVLGPTVWEKRGSHLGTGMQGGSESGPYLQCPVCPRGEWGPCEGLAAVGAVGGGHLPCAWSAPLRPEPGPRANKARLVLRPRGAARVGRGAGRGRGCGQHRHHGLRQHMAPQQAQHPGAPIPLPGHLTSAGHGPRAQGRGQPPGRGAVGAQQQWPHPPEHMGPQQWAQPPGGSRERGQEHCSPPKPSKVLQQVWDVTGAEEGPAGMTTDRMSELALVPRPR